MAITVFVALHLLGGSLAIIGGYAALFAPKGGGLHRRAGMLFVIAMVAMGIGAMVVGLTRGKSAWLGGPLVIYFVLTAVRTVRRGVTPGIRVDGTLLILALVLGALSLTGAVQGIMNPTDPLGRAPAFAGLVNGILLLLAAAGDVRVIRHGVLTGAARLRRHLWRMSFALFSATGSFFLGQPRFIPELLRDWPTRIVLAFLPLVLLLFWMWRVGRHRRQVVPAPAS